MIESVNISVLMEPQHFHTKAALMICSSRANLPQVQNKNGEIRQNRWVSVQKILICLRGQKGGVVLCLLASGLFSMRRIWR